MYRFISTLEPDRHNVHEIMSTNLALRDFVSKKRDFVSKKRDERWVQDIRKNLCE